MRSTPPVRSVKADDALRSEQLLIRPATLSDIEDFYELARLAGAGFTSLPVNEALLTKRLATSERAFEGAHGTLMLTLEDRLSGRVVGCAAVKPGGMPRPAFLNFFVHNQELQLTSCYDDMTEVGSLLLHPDYRSNGIGPFLARSRYLLIATDLERFGRQIFSELRGVVDEDDRSPFYDAVCAHHFGCSFAKADDLCAHGRQSEINALLPEGPISLQTLSPDAIKAMGQPHAAGRRALDYLEDEGFRFEGVVDLLDGGPAVIAESRSVKTVVERFEARIRTGHVDDETSAQAYIAVGSGPGFRCCRAAISVRDGAVFCSPETLANLDLAGEAIGQIRLLEEGKGQGAVDPCRSSAAGLAIDADISAG